MEAVKNNKIYESEEVVIAKSEVEVGRTYPVYGMITAILDEALPEGKNTGTLLVELNKSIKVRLKIRSADHLKTIKERIFETGIFVGEVKETSPQVEIDCKTVIFGKKREFNC